MAETFTDKPQKRVVFSKGQQSLFLLKTKEKLGFDWPLLADKLGVHRRTLFDWRREKYLLPLDPLKKLCKMARIDTPKEIEIRKAFWSVKKAAKAGGIAMFKKYGKIGNPELRKQKWQEWWEKTGKHNQNKYFIVREVSKPQFDEKLAEFIGIVMGDGGVTKRQLTIYLNAKVDKPYSIFVRHLIKEVFKLDSGVSLCQKGVIRVSVSRTLLINYLESMGLKRGNKIRHNLDMPKWIKENDTFSMACIRGLMDTDGCLFMERHQIKNKIYSYPRLSLVSASEALRNSVFLTFKRLGYLPFIRGNRSVQLESYLDIRNYFDKIGTNHPKNKAKFQALFGGFG
jgi:intein/homing endonuclease